MDIYDELTKIFQVVFDDIDLVLTSDLTYSDVPGWDSLSNMNLMVCIESMFKIKISLDEQRLFKNVGDIASYIEKMCSKNIDKGCL